MRARRLAIVTFVASLVSVWTCPVYCSAMAHQSAPAEAEGAMANGGMTGHHHHHTSQTSGPTSSPAMKGVQDRCCENCGDDQIASLSEHSAPRVRLNSLGVLPAPVPTSPAMVLVMPFDRQHFRPGSSPPLLDAAPLRI
jgi:hypothetical protein